MVVRKKKHPTSARQMALTIPGKANKILNFILLLMVFILIRSWHLAVVQHEERLEASRRPQRRVVIERAERGSIRDRYNLPLVVNKIQYNAAIFYSHIREIPSVSWVRDAEGKKVKKYLRKEHIESLSRLLAHELNMDSERIEDLIHSKASLFPNTPFVIKEDISEREYFRLKMLEKDYLGLYGEKVPKRHYVQGKVAGNIIGYMGAISREEYLSIADEMKVLGKYLKMLDQGEFIELPAGYNSSLEARERYQDLQQRAYRIHDHVGKSGIEGEFEEDLRGYYGRRVYQADSKGNYLRELPGSRESLSGKRHLLSISLELQEFAEQLLAQNEEIRDGKSTTFDWSKREYLSLKQPWIKGGAIVVLEPNSGEVLTLASYPRFDPNDFVSSGNREERKKKVRNIHRWFENDYYLADIWDGKRPLERERFSQNPQGFYVESKEMGWENYLNLILPGGNQASQGIKRLQTVAGAVQLQKNVAILLDILPNESLYHIFNALYGDENHQAHKDQLDMEKKKSLAQKLGENVEVVKRVKKELAPILGQVSHNYDKVLLVDLCRLAVSDENLSMNLLSKIGGQSLSDYRKASMSFAVLHDEVKRMAKRLFREHSFSKWRQENQKEYLRQKREEEREKGQYARSYLDYIDRKERELFASFWETYRFGFFMAFITGELPEANVLTKDLEPYFEYFKAWQEELDRGAHALLDWNRSYKSLKLLVKGLPKELVVEYLQSIRSFQDLTRPLFGSYRNIRSEGGKRLEKHLAAAFYPVYGFGYSRSQAYRQAAPQGSIFKLVVAYEALIQRFEKLKLAGEDLSRLNPLEIVDQVKKSSDNKRSWIVGYRSSGEAIPQFYAGGRLPRSEKRNIGKIDLVGALEVSSNPYFSLLAGELLENPEDLNKAAWMFSFGEPTGIDLNGEISGYLPEDIQNNRTGLYAYAIGQHSLVATPLQTAVMMSALVNGGKVFKPKVLNMVAGAEPIRQSDKIFVSKPHLYKDLLALVGVHFPLFTAAEPQHQQKMVHLIQPEVKRDVPLPPQVRELLVEGMRLVVSGERGSARPSGMRNYYSYPHIMQDYEDLHQQIIGKTSTAEIVEAIDLDLEMGAYRYKHIWFAGASFDAKEQDQKGVGSGKKGRFGKPELVVIVYLKYGNYGKEAAPLVAQIVKKWREIKSKNEKGV